MADVTKSAAGTILHCYGSYERMYSGTVFIETVHFGQNWPTLQRGLSAIAELLVRPQRILVYLDTVSFNGESRILVGASHWSLI